MAFTKIAAAGIGSTGTVILEDIRANSLVVSGVSTLGSVVATTGTFSGNVSIAGTLTYEDVTNIDSVGLITARSGVVVNTGTATTALIVNGSARITGILTIGTSSVTLDGTNNQVNVGTGVTIHHTNGVQVGGNTLHSSGLTVNQVNAIGIITASSFRGDGSALTGIAATTNVRTDSLVVSGVSTFSAGSVSAPSISPTSDSNTGIFFPAADTIAIAEGGVEALRIDSSANIGIGTNAPTTKLTITDGVAPYAATTGDLIQLKRGVSNGNDTTSATGISFANNSNGFRIAYGGTNDRLRFIDGGAIECLSLLNGGNTGIGTVSPRVKLDIGNGKLLVVQSGTPTGTYNFGVNTHVASGSGGMQVTSGSNYSYFLGNSTDIILGSDQGSTGIKVQISRTCGDNSLVISSSGQVVANYNSTIGVVNSFGHGGYYGLSANSNSTALADQRCSWFLRGSLESTNSELGNSVLLIQNTGGASVNPGDLIKGYRGSSLIFRVSGGDGSVRNSSGSYAAISDERIKQDIVDAESQWNDIKSVRVRKFKLKENVETYGESAPTFIGVIAQELEQISPGLVDQAKLKNGSLDPESIKSVKYSILYMKSVKALQEAQQRIETLESQVSLLIRKVEELENKII
jgi:hypothetical protein